MCSRRTFSVCVGIVLMLTIARVSAQSNLTYTGGPVVSNPEIVVVFHGPPSAETRFAEQFLALLVYNPTDYLDTLKEYSTVGLPGGTNQTIGAARLGASVQVPLTPTGSNGTEPIYGLDQLL